MKSVNAGWNAISSWRSRSKRCDRSGGPNPRLYVHPTQHERHGYAELACRTLLTSLQVPFLHCVLTLPRLIPVPKLAMAIQIERFV